MPHDQAPPPDASTGAVPADQPASGSFGGASAFVFGLALGAIPLVLAMIGVGGLFKYSTSSAGPLLIAGAVGLPIGLVVSVFLATSARTRQFGLGMLTALVVSPVVFFVSCLVELTRPSGL